MANPIDLATLFREQIGGRRNLIINGAMEVWQRGTSQTTSGDYAADRFWMINASSAARNTDAPSGFIYSTKLTYSASDMAFGQPIELPATGKQGQFVAGSVVTLSYYAKVASGTEDIYAAINFRDSKFSGTNQAIFAGLGSTATWTTTWTRYTHSYIVPTVNSTNTVAAFEIGAIGRDAYITGVQLEVGETATPFEHRSYGEELALCHRYYQKYPSASAQTPMFTGTGLSSTAIRALVTPFGGLMRDIPAITLPTTTYLRGNGSTLEVTSVETGVLVGAGYSFAFYAASGVTNGHVYYVTGATGGDALELSAEL